MSEASITIVAMNVISLLLCYLSCYNLRAKCISVLILFDIGLIEFYASLSLFFIYFLHIYDPSLDIGLGLIKFYVVA